MKWNPSNLHNHQNAINCAELSSAAYGTPDADIRFHDDQTDTEAFGWAADDHIAIAFRGTSSVQDARQDLKFHKVDFSTADESGTGAFTMADIQRVNHGKVHRGFLASTGSIWSTVRAWMRENYTNQPIFITGHSLGAANATLLAMRLEVDGFKIWSVYTFGCPRVGNRRFARLFNERIRHYRYVNHNDIVTRLPPFAVHTGFRYYFNRHGQRVVIGWFRELWDRIAGRLTQSVIDGANDHKMSEYLSNLTATKTL
jgi:triacylglycerol lipase